MKNLVFLVIVAVLTLAVLIFIFNPKLIQEVWLWLVGLVGPIAALGKKGVDKLKGIGGKDAIQNASVSAAPVQIKNLESKIKVLENEVKSDLDDFEGITLTVLRYFSDGDTTLGLFFVGDKFYSYTLEDAFHEKKIKGKTRIPSGTYSVDFYEVDTPLTLSYREERKPWFKYHIKIWDIPNFDNVYIHSGSDHTHTEGCLLLAKGLYDGDDKKTIFNSKETYKAFYQEFKGMRKDKKKVRIKLKDEDWFERQNMKLK